jgi:hypothetical protein
MAKNKITDYSITASSNTDVGNIQIEGSDNVANFDNALREIMKQIADLNTGASFIHDTYKIADSDEETRLAKFNAGSITAGQTRTFTFPDENGTIALAGNVLSLSGDATGGEVSSLTSAGTLDGTEIIDLVQSGNTRKATIDSISSFSVNKFTSSDQTITSAGSLTIAHGLGSAPFEWSAYLKCNTAEEGYTAGQIIKITQGHHNGSDDEGLTMQADASNVYVNFAGNSRVFQAVSKSANARVRLTNANWRLIVKAWI